MKVSEKVQVHSGNTIDGITIHERFIEGSIIKVNKKSIRVYMTHVKYVVNGKLVHESDMDDMAIFNLYKIIQNKQYGKNAGKTVSVYKNKDYGIIEIVH